MSNSEGMEKEQINIAPVAEFLATGRVPLFQRPIIEAVLLKTDATLQEMDILGRRLCGEAPAESMFLSTAPTTGAKRNLWAFVLEQIHELICTESEQYAQIRTLATGSYATTCLLVTSAVASRLHVGEAVIIGAVTVALAAPLKVGRNAFCKWISESSYDRTATGS